MKHSTSNFQSAERINSRSAEDCCTASMSHRTSSPVMTTSISVGCAGPRCVSAIMRVGAQVVEELVDLTRQNFRRGRQFAGGREDRCRGLVGLADGVAERTNVGDQGNVALGGRLRIGGDLAGRGI